MQRAARLGWSFSLALFALLPTIWVFVGPTTAGRIAALLALSLCSIPFSAMWFGRRVFAGCLVVAIVSGCWLMTHAPSTTPPPGPLTCRYLGPGWAMRTLLPRLVPEADQVYLGTLITPFFDPSGLVGARRIRDLEMSAYKEIERDPQFLALAPATEMTIADLLFLPFNNGHVFEYTPPHAAGEKLPAVLFLHGSFGNFKVYLWAMKRFADRYHCVVVLPSFGTGNWGQAGGVEVVAAARKHMLADLPVDPARLYLVGLSMGGVGVTHAALSAPRDYAGIGYLSGVMDNSLLGTEQFEHAWQGRPLLVVTGEADDRIDDAEVRSIAKRLREAGVQVREHHYPGEDHFLFLSKLDPVLADLSTWMGLRNQP